MTVDPATLSDVHELKRRMDKQEESSVSLEKSIQGVITEQRVSTGELCRLATAVETQNKLLTGSNGDSLVTRMRMTEQHLEDAKTHRENQSKNLKKCQENRDERIKEDRKNKQTVHLALVTSFIALGGTVIAVAANLIIKLL